MSQDATLQRLLRASAQYRQALDAIRQAVLQGRIVALLGPRYAAKTALLQAAEAELAGHLRELWLYIDLGQTETATNAAFFNSLIQQVAQAINERAGLAVDLPVLPNANSAIFRQFVQDCIDQLARGLVLTFDHLELVPADLMSALLSSLRSAYMNQYSAAQRLVVIVCGALSLARMTVGETSPFSNIAQGVFIGELSQADSQVLVREALGRQGVHVSRKAEIALRQAAQGDPHLIDEIGTACARLVSRTALRRVNAGTVQRAVEAYLAGPAARYPLFKDAVRMIEEDPDLLSACLLLLRHGQVPGYRLPIDLSPDLDPLALTGITHRNSEQVYSLRNDIYRQYLARHFTPGRVGYLLTLHGRWEEALDSLEESIQAGSRQHQADMLMASIQAMYAADTQERAAAYLGRVLASLYGVRQLLVWACPPNGDRLRMIYRQGAVLTASILPSEEILLKQDTQETRAYREGLTLRESESGHLVKQIIPLALSGGQKVGVATLFISPGVRDPAEQREIELQMNGYLNQAARALHEVYSRQQQAVRMIRQDDLLRSKNRQFEMLHQVSTHVQTLTDLERITHTILTAITAHFGLGFNRAWLLLLDETHTHLAGRMGIGDFNETDAYRTWEHVKGFRFEEFLARLDQAEATTAAIDAPTRRLRIPVARSAQDVFSQVIYMKAPAHYASGGGGAQPPPDFQQLFQSGQGLVVPLLARGDCLGLLTVDNQFTRRAIMHADEEMLTTFASQLAAALMNDRRRQEEQRRHLVTETLRQLSDSLLESTDLRAYLRSVLEKLAAVLPYDTASIQLYNEASQALEILVSRGFENLEAVERLSFPLEDRYPNAQVFMQMKAQRFADVQTRFPHFGQPEFHCIRVHGWLGIPLVLERKPIGVITLDSFTPERYTAEHEALASIFANQVALAIQLARLMETSRQGGENAASIETALPEYHRRLHVKELLLECLARAVDEVSGTGGGVYLWDQAEQILRLEAAYGLPPHLEGIRLAPDAGVVAQVFRTRKPAVRGDYRAWSGRLRWLDELDLATVVAAPIQVGDHFYGVLAVHDVTPGKTFSEESAYLLLRLAAELADEITISSQAAADLSELEGELFEAQPAPGKLAEISASDESSLHAILEVVEKVSQAGQLGDSLQALAGVLVERLGASFAHIWLLAEDGRHLVARAAFPVSQSIGGRDWDPALGRAIDLMAAPEMKALLSMEKAQVFDKEAEYHGRPVMAHLQAALRLDFSLRAALVAPLRSGADGLGIAVLGLAAGARQRMFTHEQIVVAQAVARQAAISIEHLQARELVQRRMRNLEYLRQVGEEITRLAAVGSREVLNRIARRACEVIGADCGTIYPFYNEETIYDVRNIGTYNLLDPHKEISPKPRRDPSSLTTQILISRDLLVVDDVESGRDRTGQVEIRAENKFVRREKVKSFVGVALKVNNEPVGVLYVNFRSQHTLLDDELRAIQIFASQAAVAIQQTRLVQRGEKDHLAVHSMYNIIRLIGATATAAPIWQTTLDHAVVITGAERGRALYWNPGTRRLTCGVHQGYSPEDHAWLDQAECEACELAEQVLAEKKTRMVLDPAKERITAECRLWQAGARSLLVIPVSNGAGGLPDGLLVLESSQFAAFTDYDRRLMDNLAAYTAAALESTRRYAEIQAHSRLQVGLLAASQGINSLSETQEVLKAIVQGVRDALRCDVVTLYAYNQERNELIFPAVVRGVLQHPEDLTTQAFVVEESALGRILARGEPYYTDDSQSDEVMKKGNFVFREGIRASGGIPLNVGRERVGILFVNYRSAYNFSAQDKAAIELFANTAAIAIQNARNYSNIQKKARHLEALNKAAGVISASVGLEQREILFRILKEAVESVTAAFGSKATSGDIYTYDPQSELLTLQAVYPPAGSGQAARPQLSLSQVRVGEFLRNELAVPIFIDSRLWGVLSVHSAAGELDEDDLAALNKLAEMAVVALKNAETARQLGRANAVAIMGAWGADIVHDINREVGAIRRVLFDLSERPDLPPGFQEQLARIDHSAGELALPSLPDQPPEPGKSLELRDAPFVDAVISSEMARYQVSHPRIEWQFTPRCPQAQAAMHEQWLRRILRHLFNNAADAMPESHPGVVAVRAAAGKEMVEIEVEDNGGGIPPRVESLLFSQPAPGAPGKMGRGLLLVRFLVEQHGGQVQLKRNQPGKGACFAIHIPVLSQG